MKPHNGKIKDWSKLYFDKEETEKEYKETPGLGFLILGKFVDHYRFGGWRGNTSWVVKWDEQPDGTIEIETRNSRYTLEKQ